jgi:hypothetical protein
VLVNDSAFSSLPLTGHALQVFAREGHNLLGDGGSVSASWRAPGIARLPRGGGQSHRAAKAKYLVEWAVCDQYTYTTQREQTFSALQKSKFFYKVKHLCFLDKGG